MLTFLLDVKAMFNIEFGKVPKFGRSCGIHSNLTTLKFWMHLQCLFECISWFYFGILIWFLSVNFQSKYQSKMWFLHPNIFMKIYSKLVKGIRHRYLKGLDHLVLLEILQFLFCGKCAWLSSAYLLCGLKVFGDVWKVNATCRDRHSIINFTIPQSKFVWTALPCRI